MFLTLPVSALGVCLYIVICVYIIYTPDLAQAVSACGCVLTIVCILPSKCLHVGVCSQLYVYTASVSVCMWVCAHNCMYILSQ